LSDKFLLLVEPFFKGSLRGEKEGSESRKRRRHLKKEKQQKGAPSRTEQYLTPEDPHRELQLVGVSVSQVVVEVG